MNYSSTSTLSLMQEKSIQKIFKISVLLKGLDGLLETIGGILLIFLKPETIHVIVAKFTQYELIEDPKDVIANYLLSISHFNFNSQIFGTIYLLSHGLIKIIIVVGLFRKKLWAYNLGLIVFSVFLIYQIYKYIHVPTLSWLILIILDVIVIILTWHEYKFVKRVNGPR